MGLVESNCTNAPFKGEEAASVAWYKWCTLTCCLLPAGAMDRVGSQWWAVSSPWVACVSSRLACWECNNNKRNTRVRETKTYCTWFSIENDGVSAWCAICAVNGDYLMKVQEAQGGRVFISQINGNKRPVENTGITSCMMYPLHMNARHWFSSMLLVFFSSF